MKIVDLRQTSVRQLQPLLEEEARHWHDELHWDYRGALDLIKRFLEAHALCGCVAFEEEVAAGYSFYVLEEQKGLIGGLYVSPRYAQAAVGKRLLEEMLFAMRAVPHLSRIEAQLMPFGGPVDVPLRNRVSVSTAASSCSTTSRSAGKRLEFPQECGWIAGMIDSLSHARSSSIYATRITSTVRSTTNIEAAPEH